MTNDSGKLKIISGNRSGEEFIVRDGMVIGRDRSCDIFIDDNAASRRHCKINIKDEGVEIIDLESRNGTKLNDKLISRAILKPKDRIEIGSTVFVYESVSVKRKGIPKAIILGAVVLFISMTIFFFVQSKEERKKQEIKIHASAGKEYYEQGKYEESLVEYEYCLKLDPQNETIRNNINKIKAKIEAAEYLRYITHYIEKGQFENAEERIKTFLAKDPQNQDVLRLQDYLNKAKTIALKVDSADILMVKNKFEDAIAILQRLYKQYSDSLVKTKLVSALLREGYELEKRGKKKEAIETFTEVLSIDQTNLDARNAIERLKPSTIAIKSSEKSLFKGPTVEKILDIKSSTAVETKEKPAEEKISSLTSEQMSEAEEVYYEGYKAEKDDNDIPKAKELYRKVLEIAPDPNFEFYKKAKARLERL